MNEFFNNINVFSNHNAARIADFIPIQKNQYDPDKKDNLIVFLDFLLILDY